MKLEVKSASKFLTNLLRLGCNRLDSNQLELFCVSVEELLRHHYLQHWFPDQPHKGSGYRCLRINHKMDPILARAGRICGMDEESLRKVLPNELTLWIDPKEVSYRIGENGSICVIYDGAVYNEQFLNECLSSSNQFSSPPLESYPSNHHQPIHNMVGSQHVNSLGTPATAALEKRSGCKETFRGHNNWDNFIVDPRLMHLDQVAAFVSS